MRWPRRQPGPPRAPGAATVAVVGLVAFASAFGVARAASSDDPAGSPASVKARPLVLRSASALPAMKGPSQEELDALQEKQARERRLAKRREERRAAKKAAAREERLRLRAERRAQRAAEREAEAKAKLAAERKKNASERRKQQQEEDTSQQPEQTTPEPPPPPTTTTPPEQFDDSG
jgi:hypothetical protein